MGTKKVKSKRSSKASKAKGKGKGKTKASKRRDELAAMSLPTEPKEPVTDILAYTGLIHGREKIGKTTALSGFPNAIFLATEPGTKGAEVYEFNAENGGVVDWEVFLRAVDLLEDAEAREQFQTVVIDTADRAYDKCLAHVCGKLRIPYPGQDASGKQDWGKSWRAVKDEFTAAIHRLEHAGFGVWFTSHTKEQEITTRGGDSYTRIYPSMSGQARSVIEALVDFFFYAEYLRDKAGNVQRVLVCQGDETIWAGARSTPHGEFPRFLPLRKEKTFDVIQNAFLDREKGIDPSELRTTRQTTKTAEEFLNKAKARESAATVRGKTKSGVRKRKKQ